MNDSMIVGTPSEGTTHVILQSGTSFRHGIQWMDGKILWLPYRWVDCFYEGRTVVDTGERMGYIDRRGEEITTVRFTSAARFREGRAFADEPEQTVLLDRNGTVVKEFGEVLLTREFDGGTAVIGRLNDDASMISEAVVGKEGEIIVDFAPYRPLHSLRDIGLDCDESDPNEDGFTIEYQEGTMLITAPNGDLLKGPVPWLT